MDSGLILALDQGTTSSRALLFDHQARLVGSAQHSFEQIYPKPAWVEHDPQEILSSQFKAVDDALAATAAKAQQIAAIGISNQRETTLVWDKKTGKPIANAIVWQCRRTSEMLEQICKDPQVEEGIIDRTGLVPDAYFSATKIAWLLNEVPGARAAAKRGELAFGTVDTWLVYQLTGGLVHATDITNASRTMLFNIHTRKWDDSLLELFDIPQSLLPEVRPSASDYGMTNHEAVPKGIRITGVAGDQQAALFGQRCFEKGEAKNTLGTGAFMLMHTGNRAYRSKNRLITTMAAAFPNDEEQSYALEGSIFVAGALIQWLRDELGLISSAAETEGLAESTPDNAGVYIVPAFTGLGAPWWDADARGAILGLTRGAGREHIVRAALESIAYQTADLVSAFEDDTELSLNSLKVDGGAAANGFLAQFMSDLLGIQISRPHSFEASGLGAAFLAGLTVGFWRDKDELLGLHLPSDEFVPREVDRDRLMTGWHQALGRVRST